MKLIGNIEGLKGKLKKPFLTIGMFDGVHLAHQSIIKEVVRKAKASEGTSIVLTFSLHPSKILKKWPTASLITSLAHRIDLIKRLGVDICLLLDFNKEFSRMPAKDFIKHILIDVIGINYLAVGQGFRFGKDRAGTYSLLRKFSKMHGFKLRRINSVKINGKIISSSRIRAFIQRGKINQAAGLLGRDFSILGKVTKGNARGRILGYPTANIAPLQEIVPLAGVYAVFVKLDNKIFPGILNIGKRPTFRQETSCLASPDTQDFSLRSFSGWESALSFPIPSKKITSDTIEVHIFNFRKNIYGRKLEVFFIQRIRPEKKFSSREELVKQIKKDELKVKKNLTRKLPSAITLMGNFRSGIR